MPSRNARAPWWTVMVWATWRNRDQFQPVQALGAGLVAVDLRQPGIHGRVGENQAVDVSEPKEPADGVHAGDHRGVHEAALAEPADVQLDVSALDPDERVEPIGLTPGEPFPQLGCIHDVSAPGVPGQIGDRRQLGGRHRRGLEREHGRRNGHSNHLARRPNRRQTSPRRNDAARHHQRSRLDPAPRVRRRRYRHCRSAPKWSHRIADRLIANR